MKLYSVHLWGFYLDQGEQVKEERNVFIPAKSEEEAETKALEDDFLDFAEAVEVNEIDGYKIIFEKIQ